MNAQLVARGLHKSYGNVKAVHDVGFDIAAGEVLGLLGPNGAGKTSTLEICAGLSQPDTGSVTICGIDAPWRHRAARERLGVVLQATALQDALTPREALCAFGAFYRAPVAAGALLQRFGLASLATRRIAQLSGGERQRLHLALAFVNDPAVILLDEPTVSLDPPMRREFHEHIRQLKRAGRALLLATHDMEEAGALCDRVLILNAGRIVAAGTPRDLLERHATEQSVEVRTDAPVDPAWLTACDAIHAPLRGEDGLRFTTADLNAALAQLTRALESRVRITELRAGRGRLEDLILSLSRANRDASGA